MSNLQNFAVLFSCHRHFVAQFTSRQSKHAKFASLLWQRCTKLGFNAAIMKLSSSDNKNVQQLRLVSSVFNFNRKQQTATNKKKTFSNQLFEWISLLTWIKMQSLQNRFFHFEKEVKTKLRKAEKATTDFVFVLNELAKFMLRWARLRHAEAGLITLGLFSNGLLGWSECKSLAWALSENKAIIIHHSNWVANPTKTSSQHSDGLSS